MLAIILILLAFTPMIKLRVSQENGGWENLETTMNVVQGLSAQNLLFLASTESVNTYTLSHWDGQKFYCNETRKSHALDCTQHAITILNTTGGLELSENMTGQITSSADTYYAENKDEPWFGPTQIRQYQFIKKMFNQTPALDAENILNKSWTGTAFAEYQGGEDPTPKATYNAILFLKDHGKNFTIIHEFTGGDHYSKKIRQEQGIQEQTSSSMIMEFVKIYAPPTRFTSINDEGIALQELSNSKFSIILIMVVMLVLAILFWNI